MDLQLVPHKGRNCINGTVIFEKDIKDYFLDFLITIPKSDGKNWTLLNVTLKGCEFIKGLQNKLFTLPNIIFNIKSKENSFYPKKCPIPKVYLFFIGIF